MVADSSYAVIELLSSVKDSVRFITRLRLDAALYDKVPDRQPGKAGRNRLKGGRQPTLKARLGDAATQWQRIIIAQWYNEKDKEVEVATDTALWYHSGMKPVEIRWVLIKDKAGKNTPVALLSTHTEMSAEDIITYFIRRWSMEVTFKEGRAHLGMETQRQWSDKAIERTTPCLMGLFSITALWADALQHSGELRVEQAAWYKKDKPTFSDALAAVRNNIWQNNHLYTSSKKEDMIKIPTSIFQRLTDLLAAAA